MSFTAGQIKAAARSRWDVVFSVLAPSLKAAMRAGRKQHVSCPKHGGVDGFRLFSDWVETGGCICNTCGSRPDGFATLQWLNGWDFPTTVEKVAEVLGFQREDCRPMQLFPIHKQWKVSGKLVDFGTAPHEFVPGRAVSFYARINNENRTDVLWGQALKRAIELGKVKAGEWVEFVKIGMREHVGKDGKARKSAVWTAREVESPEERALREAEAARLDAMKAEAIDRTWSNATPLTSDSRGTRAVLAYLKRRGITLSARRLAKDDAIRASDLECPLEGDSSYPAMIAAVRGPQGNLVTLHVTYLTEDGFKAPVATPKRIMSLPAHRTIRQGAIRLAEPSQLLAVSEGIETALSVSTALRIPCWATISAGGMKTVDIPDTVHYLLIMADKDASRVGEEAALSLRERMQKQGREVFVLTPEEAIPKDAKGIDWNDVLLCKGKAGFDLPGFI